MARVKVVAVGKLKESYWREAAAEYLKRLSRYAKVEVIEVDEGKGDVPKTVVEREGGAIAERLEGSVWLMDLQGTPTSSEAFAEHLNRALIEQGTLTIVIGGSHGVSDRVRAAAHRRVQFGPQTMPHQLARVVVLEQLYRAFTILNGVTYHK